MSYENPTAKYVLDRFSRMKTERATYESNWQDIRDLVRPGTADFTRGTSPGQSRTDKIYDGTAPISLEQLAGGLHSYLTNPADPWFTLEDEDMDALQNEPDSLLYLQYLTDTIMTEYRHPAVRFYPAIKESYLDVGGFGTCVLNQEVSPTGHLYFRTHALASCWFERDSEGLIDTVLRKMCYDKRQLIQEFGESNLPKKVLEEKREDKKHEVIHAVYPREDYDPGKLDATNMPYASVWVLVEHCHVLKESGYKSLPYHVGRWSTIADETYGYSPAHSCLPDIRMLNRMEYTIIKSATKAVDPTVWIPNEGVMTPIVTKPGGINYYENGIEEPFRVMEHKGNLPIGLEMTDRKREMIRKAFHLDWVEITRKKERQTAYELQQDEEENIRQMGPILGGLMSDILHPCIARSFQLLKDAGRIKSAPEVLNKRKLKIVYVSPAAKAQKAMSAINIGRVIQEITPLAQVAPEIMDAFDMDEVAQVLVDSRSVNRRVVRSPEQIAALRQERKMAQDAMAAAEIAKPMSEAVKNLALANQAGNIA
jgi:hypothetical protein